MDSEKITHMREMIAEGRPVTDKGPYSHRGFWEGYKGSVEGKLGGSVIGGILGTAAGILAATGLLLLAPATLVVTTAMIGTTIAGFTAAGLVYGAHEFSDIGKSNGPVAAGLDEFEKRIKPFIEAQTKEIKEDVEQVKAMVKGEALPEKSAEAETELLKAEQDNYRTEHFQGCTPDTDKPIFWKVAIIGLLLGVTAGIMLGMGGLTTHLLEGLGVAEGALGKLGATLASATALGAVGASFGVNRDLFRQVFDKTDLWTRGFASHEHSVRVLKGHEKATEKSSEIEPKQSIVYNSPIQYPESETHHQDVLSAGRKALMEMDHTKMSPH